MLDLNHLTADINRADFFASSGLPTDQVASCAALNPSPNTITGIKTSVKEYLSPFLAVNVNNNNPANSTDMGPAHKTGSKLREK